MSTTTSISCKAIAQKKTLQYLRQKKEHGEPITMLTGYDYSTAMILDRSGY